MASFLRIGFFLSCFVLSGLQFIIQQQLFAISSPSTSQNSDQKKNKDTQEITKFNPERSFAQNIEIIQNTEMYNAELIKKFINIFGISLHASGAFEVGSRFATKLDEKEAKGNISKNHDNFAFFNQVGLAVRVAPKIKNVKIGVHIPLISTGKRSGSSLFNSSYLFFESKFGLVKLGAPTDAADDLRIDGISGIAVGGFGNSERYSYSMNDKEFIDDADSFLSSKFNASLNNSNSSEKSRKITVHFPKIDILKKCNISLAASFVPDSSNTGAGKSNQDLVPKKIMYFSQDGKMLDSDSGSDVFQNLSTKIVKENLLKNSTSPDTIVSVSHVVKNAISAATKVNIEFNDLVNLVLGGSIEYGESVGEAIFYDKASSASDNIENSKTNDNKKYKQKSSHKLENLLAGGLGAELSVGDFALGVAWHDWGKSFFNKELYQNVTSSEASKNYSVSASCAYSVGPFKVSLAGLVSDKFSNLNKKFAFATQCKLFSLANAYVQLVHSNKEGKSFYDKKIDDEKEKLTDWGWNFGLNVSL